MTISYSMRKHKIYHILQITGEYIYSKIHLQHCQSGTRDTGIKLKGSHGVKGGQVNRRTDTK